MRINATDSIVGDLCILVPYCSKHVQKYHEWMGSEKLRSETYSEALTLEEEQKMQKAWKEDSDKLTFIILDKHTAAERDREEDEVPRERKREQTFHSEIASMVGDINAFLCSTDHCFGDKHEDASIWGQRNDCVDPQHNEERRCFELSVMVAVPEFRRRGIAHEACKLMMTYILHRVDGKSNFIAKISAKNLSSLALFRDRLGFNDCGFSKVFDLVTLCLENERAKELVDHIQLRIEPYKGDD